MFKLIGAIFNLLVHLIAMPFQIVGAISGMLVALFGCSIALAQIAAILIVGMIIIILI